jgi:hypothetical protein
MVGYIDAHREAFVEVCADGDDAGRQKAAQVYRGQIPSPGAPTVAWREDRVGFWEVIAGGVKLEATPALEGQVSPAVDTHRPDGS